MDLEYLLIDPPHPPHLCIIWLHGLGADGHNFASMPQALALPEALSARFILPHAPLQPVSVANGLPMRAWFDIQSLGKNIEFDKAGVLTMHQQLAQLIASQLDFFPSEKIVLAGFSQGGSMALYSGLHFPQPLGGIIALSTFLAEADTLTAGTVDRHRPPIFQAHGLNDEVVDYRLGEWTAQTLQAAHFPVEWKTYPFAHEVNAVEIQDIRHWLIRQFPV